ncbi:DUF1127 domain-containing protein [Pseudomonas indica]|uniref:YjiS-like domain-containing protein n=1 Tax=Pseudomonas indica TaxID=137658 RepID=A0A1G8TLM5_9PSED|nr:DUF1127 domain-containing protein [Pseudomonas indica]MBU3058884.1 DUF1127 domain-containing protein [Pseudomonas indica]PAU55078.1 hypothetical protein BZL42_19815 [Pseudomonas indica]SDJ42418.1 protein of unknown function [Pseudomonas indica]
MREWSEVLVVTRERDAQAGGIRFTTGNADEGRWQRFWRRLTTRHALARLDDAQLRDIGLTRQEALAEVYRPVWQLWD